MRTLNSLIVSALALVAFGMWSAGASASTITANNPGYTATAARTITLDPGGLAINCDVTFRLGLARTSVTAAALPALVPSIGVVAGRAGSCDAGFALTLLGMPWVADAAFIGGMGNVTGATRFLVHDVQFEQSSGTGVFRCLYQGNVTVFLNAAGTTATISANLPLISGSVLCPSPGRLAGTAAISPAAVFVLS